MKKTISFSYLGNNPVVGFCYVEGEWVGESRAGEVENRTRRANILVSV